MVHHTENESSGQSATPIIAFDDEDPIVAIATAPGRGSIGVVRVSGKNLQGLLADLVNQHRIIGRHAHYLPIHDQDGSLIDQAIVIYFPAPNSFTGEDVIEVQGHGGSAVMHLLLQRCLTLGSSIGLRLAQPGEFSLRAFLNDKIDLAQAEAISDLIDASSTAAAKAAAASLSGTFSQEVNKLADELVLLRTLVEATLDFPEEEIEFIEKYQVKEKLQKINELLSHVISISKQSTYLREGIKVVLAGEPNVGKSSLLNAICDQDIAIVTDVAGTTRDRIRETLQIDGLPIQITDTAGLRDTTDPVERIGIDRTWQSIAESDLILDVMDARDPRSFIVSLQDRNEYRDKRIISVYNKSDLLNNKSSNLSVDHDNSLLVSAKTGQGITELKKLMLAHAGRQLGEVSPWLGRLRHVQALELAQAHLLNALEHAKLDDRVLDLLAEELRLSHDALGKITGSLNADELLGKIFSSFCIGK